MADKNLAVFWRQRGNRVTVVRQLRCKDMSAEMRAPQRVRPGRRRRRGEPGLPEEGRGRRGASYKQLQGGHRCRPRLSWDRMGGGGGGGGGASAWRGAAEGRAHNAPRRRLLPPLRWCLTATISAPATTTAKIRHNQGRARGHHFNNVLSKIKDPKNRHISVRASGA